MILFCFKIKPKNLRALNTIAPLKRDIIPRLMLTTIKTEDTWKTINSCSKLADRYRLLIDV